MGRVQRHFEETSGRCGILLDSSHAEVEDLPLPGTISRSNSCVIPLMSVPLISWSSFTKHTSLASQKKYSFNLNPQLQGFHFEKMLLRPANWELS